VVTQEVFTLLWKLRIALKCKRLSDVILKLMESNFSIPEIQVLTEVMDQR